MKNYSKGEILVSLFECKGMNCLDHEKCSFQISKSINVTTK